MSSSSAAAIPAAALVEQLRAARNSIKNTEIAALQSVTELLASKKFTFDSAIALGLGSVQPGTANEAEQQTNLARYAFFLEVVAILTKAPSFKIEEPDLVESRITGNSLVFAIMRDLASVLEMKTVPAMLISSQDLIYMENWLRYPPDSRAISVNDREKCIEALGDMEEAMDVMELAVNSLGVGKLLIYLKK